MTSQISNFKVTDKESFIDFINSLRSDLLTSPESWENKNLDDFLEAMSSYVEGIQGYYDNTNQAVDTNQASWQLFADIFKGSRIYE